MHLLTRIFAITTLVGAITTTVWAQSTPTPAPTATTNPNTKVYAYKKAAPASATSPGSSASHSQMARDPDVPAFGTQKWWEEKNRYGNGDGGN